MKRHCPLLLVLLLSPLAALAQDTPVGRWKTIDDATGEPRSMVAITESGGKLSGTVERVLLKPSEAPPTCTKCSGSRRNQPVQGMNILWGVSRKGEGWEGGSILDPKTGKVYSVKLRMLDSGKLEVRGYMGFSLLGRTQVWTREP